MYGIYFLLVLDFILLFNKKIWNAVVPYILAHPTKKCHRLQAPGIHSMGLHQPLSYNFASITI